MLQHILMTSYIIAEWYLKSTFNLTEIVNGGQDGKEHVNSKTY